MTAVGEQAVSKIAGYMSRKYNALGLTQYEACKELLFRGREFSKVLGTNRLPTLNVRHVAQYIVLHT